MDETVFDEVIKGSIPVDLVYEDESLLAFRDINPQAPVHVLVIPKKKIARLAELDQWSVEDTGVFFQGVSKVARELKLNGSGYRIVINNGTDGGQDVEYLHAHILGGRRLTWPPG